MSATDQDTALAAAAVNRAVLVVGMHRSGTSALTRGVRALSVDLGDNFFEIQADNPKGYWEDKTIVGISQRVLEELRITWDDTTLLERDRFQHYRIRLLRLKAVRYFKEAFTSRPVWGFKDPRSIRLLPFWVDALRDCEAHDAYILAIRHPHSVAMSLHRRQQIPEQKAQRLWLLHNVPFLHELRNKPLVVVDYDLLMQEPREQLERVARKLDLPLDATTDLEIERFAGEFLDESLRHSVFEDPDPQPDTDLGRLTLDAYGLLRELATDNAEADPAFWSAWSDVSNRLLEV